MQKIKTHDSVKKINNKNNRNNLQSEDLYATLGKYGQKSTRNIKSNKLDISNNYKNFIHRKYNSKIQILNNSTIQIKNKLKSNEKKNKINLEKDKEKDNTKKIHIILNGQNYKSEKNNSPNGNKLFNNTKIYIRRKNKKNNNDDNNNNTNNNINEKVKNLKKIILDKDSLYVSKNSSSRQNLNEKKNSEKFCDINHNGGNYISKKFGEKEKNIIFSKINIIKKNNYFNNYKLKRKINSKIYNNDKTLTERNESKLSIDNFEDIIINNIKKKNRRFNNLSQNTNSLEYTENGGFTMFNKSYDNIKSAKKNISNNINNNSIIINKNKPSKLMNSYKYKKDIEIKKENKNNQNENRSQKSVNKNNTYKTLNLTVNKKCLINNFPPKNNYILTSNTSRNNISYKKNLEQKKNLLRLNLNCKDIKIIEKKIKEDLSSNNTRRSLFNTHRTHKIDDDDEQIVKIIDEKNNKIKVIRKRIGNKSKTKRNLKNKYENELMKKKKENNNLSINKEKKNFEKKKKKKKKIDFNKMPKGLELMRRLTEMK